MAQNYEKYFAQSIEQELATHYKKKDLEFDYVSSKDFKQIDENENPAVIGCVKLKAIDKTNCDILTIESNGQEYNFEIIDKNDDPYDKDERNNKRRITGYIKVGENTYISIIKTNFLLIFIPIGIIGLLLVGLSISGIINPPNPNIDPDTTESLEIETGEDISFEEPSEEATQENITIPGYANLYVTGEYPEIHLINPEGNTVYFRYIIKNGEEVLHETKAIEPNKMVRVNLKELLPVGEYTLTFVIETFDLETQAGCNGASQEVRILVKE